ncbi:hypothetical protein G6L37_07065 [Agrobacterium rubi]|nr:hypothetical protein [Agrobacterium rubi]NTF25126.1 hypothetical protein [Agrobacterium rubi]
MSFPWMTEAERRKRREDEEFARRAALDLSLELAGVKAPRRSEADGMADILRRQSELNVLRPARERFRPSSGSRLPPAKSFNKGSLDE